MLMMKLMLIVLQWILWRPCRLARLLRVPTKPHSSCFLYQNTVCGCDSFTWNNIFYICVVSLSIDKLVRYHLESTLWRRPHVSFMQSLIWISNFWYSATKTDRTSHQNSTKLRSCGYYSYGLLAQWYGAAISFQLLAQMVNLFDACRYGLLFSFWYFALKKNQRSKRC